MNKTAKTIIYILESKKKTDKNFAVALRQAGSSESEIQSYFLYLPDFTKISLQEGEEFYRMLREQYILALRKTFGLAYREISRRLGGESYQAARKIVQDDEKKDEAKS